MVCVPAKLWGEIIDKLVFEFTKQNLSILSDLSQSVDENSSFCLLDMNMFFYCQMSTFWGSVKIINHCLAYSVLI